MAITLDKAITCIEFIGCNYKSLNDCNCDDVGSKITTFIETDEIIAYSELSGEDFYGKTIAHEWWYKGELAYVQYSLINFHTQSGVCFWTYRQMGLTGRGLGTGYIKILVDGIYIGQTNNYTVIASPTGACCYSPTACAEESEYDCMGEWKGIGTTCTPNPCSSGKGACCTNGTTCTQTTEAECNSQPTGYFLGLDTACSPNPCGGSHMGACCLGTTCMQTNYNQCPGLFIAIGSTCTPNPCQETGACCINEICTETIRIGCGGDWQGLDTTCTPNPCVNPTDCINPTAINESIICGDETYTQDETHKYQCLEGTWYDQGYDASCWQLGACCNNGICSQTTQYDCIGDWKIDVSCDPNPCPSIFNMLPFIIGGAIALGTIGIIALKLSRKK